MTCGGRFFASRHGADGRIAKAIATTLGYAGITAQVHDVWTRPILLDATLWCSAVGSSIPARPGLPEARRYARTHGSSLRARPVWLFSSGPLGLTLLSRRATKPHPATVSRPPPR